MCTVTEQGRVETVRFRVRSHQNQVRHRKVLVYSDRAGAGCHCVLQGQKPLEPRCATTGCMCTVTEQGWVVTVRFRVRSHQNQVRHRKVLVYSDRAGAGCHCVLQGQKPLEPGAPPQGACVQ